MVLRHEAAHRCGQQDGLADSVVVTAADVHDCTARSGVLRQRSQLEGTHRQQGVEK